MNKKSHFLLAACGPDELAREDQVEMVIRGRFTRALLEMFSRASPDQIMYADILDRLPLIRE